jgi:hypothetical protein
LIGYGAVKTEMNINLNSKDSMKKAIRLFTISLWRDIGFLLLLCCPLLCAPSHGFDLVADFSTNANPNGVWSYGWSTSVGGQFQLLTNSVSFLSGLDVGWWDEMGVPESVTLDKDFSTNSLQSGTVIFDPDTLHMDPESYAVMSRFTAPSNGSYQVSGFFRLQDTGAQAHALIILANGNTTNYTFSHRVEPTANSTRSTSRRP